MRLLCNVVQLFTVKLKELVLLVSSVNLPNSSLVKVLYMQHVSENRSRIPGLQKKIYSYNISRVLTSIML
jgi:hypothetical protein